MTEPTPRAHEAHWGLPATLAWSVLIASAFVVLQFATLAGLSLAGYVPGAAEYDGTLIAYASAATGVLCTGLIVGIVKLKRGARVVDALGLHRVSAGTLFRWLAIAVALIAVADFLTAALGRPVVPEFMREAYATAKPLWLFWLALVVAAPVFEETFFRGFLFTGLERSALGPAGAVVATAAVWAVIHLQYDAYEMALIFCFGLVLGVARLATRSLLVPLAMHATINVVATVETAFVVTRQSM